MIPETQHIEARAIPEGPTPIDSPAKLKLPRLELKPRKDIRHLDDLAALADRLGQADVTMTTHVEPKPVRIYERPRNGFD